MKKFIFLLLFLIGSLIACSSELENESTSYEIGIIGSSTLDLDGHNVIEVSLNELRNNEYIFDALLIAKEELSYALSPENQSVYKDLKFPVFFIGLQEPLYDYIAHESNYEEEYLGDSDLNDLLAQYVYTLSGEIVFGEIRGDQGSLEHSLILTLDRQN
ncbi:hypothetical protein [Halalkalibacter urbisdiaboli]|uniref:hypothetical protein n=1 Tax=Halalkalibacter urbisdiaboli TaxID=1960589 RepID=UPI000B43A104|nr:hypothetical protein [Halalkalibacter urbisdiaboli]